MVGAAPAVKTARISAIDVIHALPDRDAAPSRPLLYSGDLVDVRLAFVALYWSWEASTCFVEFGSVNPCQRISLVCLAGGPYGFGLMMLRLPKSFVYATPRKLS